jgi:hypothetical protein
MVKETLMPELFVLIMTSGGGSVFFLLRWLKGKTMVSGLRMDAVKADAQLEAAREAARLAEGTAAEQRVIVGDALYVAKRVEHVDETLTWVAEFLASRVAWRSGDAPGLPGGPGQPSITAGDQEEGAWS